MKLIVASDERNGIGKAGGIPWRIPEDMARFKTLTMGGTVIMGRKTWESLPAKVRPLPGRRNVVITTKHYAETVGAPHPMLMTASSLGMLHYAYQCGPPGDPGTEWVIGGGSIYAEAIRLGLVDEIHLTRVQGDFGCDVFWPGIPDGWVQVECPQASVSLAISRQDSWTATPNAWFRFETWVKPLAWLSAPR